MSALDQALLINVIVLLAVLEADVGPHRKISWFRIARPLVLAGAIIPIYLKSLTTHGTGLYLELAGDRCRHPARPDGDRAHEGLPQPEDSQARQPRRLRLRHPLDRRHRGPVRVDYDLCTGSARSSARGWPPTTSSPEPSPTPSSSWPWACFLPAPSVWPSAPGTLAPAGTRDRAPVNPCFEPAGAGRRARASLSAACARHQVRRLFAITAWTAGYSPSAP